jgi:hypothetical protein
VRNITLSAEINYRHDSNATPIHHFKADEMMFIISHATEKGSGSSIYTLG